MATRRDPPVEVEEVDAAISFLEDVQARLASDPAAQGEFIGLLLNFDSGDSSDARADVARAAALLNAHPDLLARFNQFLRPSQAPPPQDLNIHQSA